MPTGPLRTRGIVKNAEWLICICIRTSGLKTFLNTERYCIGDFFEITDRNNAKWIYLCVSIHKSETIARLIIEELSRNDDQSLSCRQEKICSIGLRDNLAFLKGVVRLVHIHIENVKKNSQRMKAIQTVPKSVQVNLLQVAGPPVHPEPHRFHSLETSLTRPMVEDSSFIDESQLEIIQDCLKFVPDGEKHLTNFMKKKKLRRTF